MAYNGRDHGASYLLPQGLAGSSNRTISIDGSNTSINPGLASQGANTPARRVVSVNGNNTPNTPNAPEAPASRFTNPLHNPYRQVPSPQNTGVSNGMGFSTAGSLANSSGQYDGVMDMNKEAMSKVGEQNDLKLAIMQQQQGLAAKAFAVNLKNQQTMARQMTA
jgi:hypothetical protein